MNDLYKNNRTIDQRSLWSNIMFSIKQLIFKIKQLNIIIRISRFIHILTLDFVWFDKLIDRINHNYVSVWYLVLLIFISIYIPIIISYIIMLIIKKILFTFCLNDFMKFIFSNDIKHLNKNWSINITDLFNNKIKLNWHKLNLLTSRFFFSTLSSNININEQSDINLNFLNEDDLYKVFLRVLKIWYDNIYDKINIEFNHKWLTEINNTGIDFKFSANEHYILMTFINKIMHKYVFILFIIWITKQFLMMVSLCSIFWKLMKIYDKFSDHKIIMKPKRSVWLLCIISLLLLVFRWWLYESFISSQWNYMEGSFFMSLSSYEILQKQQELLLNMSLNKHMIDAWVHPDRKMTYKPFFENMKNMFSFSDKEDKKLFLNRINENLQISLLLEEKIQKDKLFITSIDDELNKNKVWDFMYVIFEPRLNLAWKWIFFFNTENNLDTINRILFKIDVDVKILDDIVDSMKKNNYFLSYIEYNKDITTLYDRLKDNMNTAKKNLYTLHKKIGPDILEKHKLFTNRFGNIRYNTLIENAYHIHSCFDLENIWLLFYLQYSELLNSTMLLNIRNIIHNDIKKNIVWLIMKYNIFNVIWTGVKTQLVLYVLFYKLLSILKNNHDILDILFNKLKKWFNLKLIYENRMIDHSNINIIFRIVICGLFIYFQHYDDHSTINLVKLVVWNTFTKYWDSTHTSLLLEHNIIYKYLSTFNIKLLTLLLNLIIFIKIPFWCLSIYVVYHMSNFIIIKCRKFYYYIKNKIYK